VAILIARLLRDDHSKIWRAGFSAYAHSSVLIKLASHPHHAADRGGADL
jgi:hypothetical protein